MCRGRGAIEAMGRSLYLSWRDSESLPVGSKSTDPCNSECELSLRVSTPGREKHCSEECCTCCEWMITDYGDSVTRRCRSLEMKVRIL